MAIKKYIKIYKNARITVFAQLKTIIENDESYSRKRTMSDSCFMTVKVAIAVGPSPKIKIDITKSVNG